MAVDDPTDQEQEMIVQAPMLDSRFSLLTLDFLIRWLGGSDNGQWELWLVNPDWLVQLSELLRLLILSIIVMRKTKVLFGVVVMILPLVLVVMILPLVL